MVQDRVALVAQGPAVLIMVQDRVALAALDLGEDLVAQDQVGLVAPQERGGALFLEAQDLHEENLKNKITMSIELMKEFVFLRFV
jgi:hypothetical protein